MRKKLAIAFIVAIVCILFAACAKTNLTYTITVEGEASESGAIYFLDYSINVYQDQASNPCGDCEQQPVHLFVGVTAEETAQAIADVIDRADDLWEVKSVDGDTVVLQEKTQGSVTELPAMSGPSGLKFTTSYTGGINVTAVQNSETAEASGSSDSSEEVTWLENPERLAAVYGPSYELLTMLGAEDKIVVRADVQTDDFPWAEKVFSRITEVPALENVHTSVNFEELMKYEPQIVYSFPRQNEMDQLKSAGVAYLAGQSGETLEDLKSQVRAYAETLGEDAEERAEEYCTYFDEKLAKIKEVTDTISDDEKKTVYYAGIDILTTYGKYSDLMEVVEAAGGILVSKNLEAGNRSQINYEQLMSWNPDYIFIDHGGINDGKSVETLKEELTTDSAYSALTAVKNDNVYLSPSGVFYWDMGIQKILLIENMAKTLYPEKFEDLDMESEIMEFYEKFFGYTLTREDATKILNREAP